MDQLQFDIILIGVKLLLIIIALWVAKVQTNYTKSDFRSLVNKDRKIRFKDILMISVVIIGIYFILKEDELWNYSNDLFAGFLGVLAGFALDREYVEKKENEEKLIKKSKLDLMLCYICMELEENWYYITDKSSSTSYITNIWNAYKEKLYEWDNEKLIMVLRIYNYFESRRSTSVGKNKEKLEFINLIEDVLNHIYHKIDEDEEFKRKMEKVREEYSNMQQKIGENDVGKPFKPKYFPKTS